MTNEKSDTPLPIFRLSCTDGYVPNPCAALREAWAELNRLRAAESAQAPVAGEVASHTGYIAARNINEGAESADLVDPTRVRAMAQLIASLSAQVEALKRERDDAVLWKDHSYAVRMAESHIIRCNRMQDRAEAAEQRAASLQADVERLEELVYVPGVWKCAKCSLSLVSSIISPQGMKANTEPQQCANGCGPMWRKTERDAGNELCDRLDALADEKIALQAELSALKGAIADGKRTMPAERAFDWITERAAMLTAARTK